MYWKERVWEPSPYTVRGVPVRACAQGAERRQHIVSSSNGVSPEGTTHVVLEINDNQRDCIVCDDVRVCALRGINHHQLQRTYSSQALLLTVMQAHAC